MSVKFNTSDEWEDFIFEEIAGGDNRYYAYENIYRCAYLGLKGLLIFDKIKIDENGYYPNEDDKFEFNIIRGYKDIRVFNHFKSRGWNLHRIESNYIDMILIKNKKKLWFEFGPCRVNKIWNYLMSQKYFIVVPVCKI